MYPFMDLANELKEKVLEHVDTEELLKTLQINQFLRHYVLHHGPFSKTLLAMHIEVRSENRCLVYLMTSDRMYYSCRQIDEPKREANSEELAIEYLSKRLRFFPNFSFTDVYRSVDWSTVKPLLPQGRHFNRIKLVLPEWDLIELFAKQFDSRAVNQFELKVLSSLRTTDITSEKALIKDIFVRNAMDCQELIVNSDALLEDLLAINETTKSRRIFWQFEDFWDPKEWFDGVYAHWPHKNQEKLGMLGVLLAADSECVLETFFECLTNETTISKFTVKEDPLFKCFAKEWPLLEQARIYGGRYVIVEREDSSGVYLHFVIDGFYAPGLFMNYIAAILTIFITNLRDILDCFHYDDFCTRFE